MKASVQPIANLVLEGGTVGKMLIGNSKSLLNLGLAPVEGFSSIILEGKQWKCVLDDLEVTYTIPSPEIVALARRVWNRGYDKSAPYDVDIPSFDEAVAELRSGKDIHGRNWPILDGVFLPFNEFMEQLNNGKEEYVVSN